MSLWLGHNPGCSRQVATKCGPFPQPEAGYHAGKRTITKSHGVVPDVVHDCDLRMLGFWTRWMLLASSTRTPNAL
jgi:hypothetical protein